MNTVNCFNSMVRCKRTNNNISLMPRCIGAIIMVMSRPKANIVCIHAMPIIKAVGMLCAVCVCVCVCVCVLLLPVGHGIVGLCLTCGALKLTR